MIWIVIILLIILFFIRASKGKTYSLESIIRPIDSLLKYGYDKGFLIINIGYSKKFVQLRKYINEPKNYGIELGFPFVKWTKDYYPKLKHLCDEKKINYEIYIGDYMKPVEFLYINFKKDVEYAHNIVKLILKEIFLVKENVKLFARLENGSLGEKIIESKDDYM